MTNKLRLMPSAEVRISFAWIRQLGSERREQSPTLRYTIKGHPQSTVFFLLSKRIYLRSTWRQDNRKQLNTSTELTLILHSLNGHLHFYYCCSYVTCIANPWERYQLLLFWSPTVHNRCFVFLFVRNNCSMAELFPDNSRSSSIEQVS